MNSKIDTFIRTFKREKDTFNKISILVETRKEIDKLQKELAKKIR